MNDITTEQRVILDHAVKTLLKSSDWMLTDSVKMATPWFSDTNILRTALGLKVRSAVFTAYGTWKTTNQIPKSWQSGKTAFVCNISNFASYTAFAFAITRFVRDCIGTSNWTLQISHYRVAAEELLANVFEELPTEAKHILNHIFLTGSYVLAKELAYVMATSASSHHFGRDLTQEEENEINFALSSISSDFMQPGQHDNQNDHVGSLLKHKLAEDAKKQRRECREPIPGEEVIVTTSSGTKLPSLALLAIFGAAAVLFLLPNLSNAATHNSLSANYSYHHHHNLKLFNHKA